MIEVVIGILVLTVAIPNVVFWSWFTVKVLRDREFVDRLP